MPTVSENAENLTPTLSFPRRGNREATGEFFSPRVLYIASTKSQGGIERHSVELAAEMHTRGVPIQFACPPGSYLETWCHERGVSTLPFHVRNSGDLGAAVRLAQRIHAERISIVHAHSRRDYVIAVLGVALARRYSRRRPGLILHAHMMRPLGSPARLSGRFFEWGADAVAAVSGPVCDCLRAAHRFSSDFVYLIHNGVNLEDFADAGSPESRKQRDETRREWDFPPDALVLGMIGRLDAKGQAELLTIAPELIRGFPSLRFVFIGSEGTVGERARLAGLAEAGGFRERLLLTGPREDIPRLLPALDILVHLPQDESFGLALAEAMAAGLPTVASGIGGCREVVQNGVTGILIPPGDAQALLEALRPLLDVKTGTMRRHEMGRQGRLAVEKNFSRDRQIHRLLALYREVCPSPTC